MNIFHRQFSTGQVVAATGVSNASIQSWLKRDLVIGHKSAASVEGAGAAPIEGGGSPGAHRRFSFYNVMEIATAKALLDAGLGSVSDAFKAGTRFAHISTGQIPGIGPERLPGLPFPGACFTVLCVRGGNAVIDRWTPQSDFYANVRNRLGKGFVVLEVNPIFEKVTNELGHDYRDVLELAYGDAA